MTNIQGQEFNQIFQRPTTNSCPKCGGCMMDCTPGFKCYSCGLEQPPVFTRTSSHTVKEGDKYE